MQQVSHSHPENIKEHMYAFGQSKKGSKMPVNTATIQRRERLQGGRDVGLSERRAQDGGGWMMVRIVRIVRDCSVHFQLKPHQNRQPHSLSTNIDRNAPNAKKH